MKFIQDKERKELSKEFYQRHGRIDKLIDGSGRIIGYLVRAELSTPTDTEAEVILKLSLNVDYHFRDAEERRNKQYQIRDYQQADLKYFAIKAALKKCISCGYSDSPCSAFSWHDSRDDIAFLNFVYAEINQTFNFSYNTQKEMYKWEGDTMKYLDLKLAFNNEQYEQLSTYIFKCVKNVLKYYKDKTVRFFFL